MENYVTGGLCGVAGATITALVTKAAVGCMNMSSALDATASVGGVATTIGLGCLGTAMAMTLTAPNGEFGKIPTALAWSGLVSSLGGLNLSVIAGIPLLAKEGLSFGAPVAGVAFVAGLATVTYGMGVYLQAKLIDGGLKAKIKDRGLKAKIKDR